MLKRPYSQIPSVWLLGTLLTIAGCSTPVSTPTPTVTPSVVVSSATSEAAAPAPQSSDADAYKQALGKAASAESLSQDALSTDDWNLVTSRWQQAIEGLRSLPAGSPYESLAKTKLKQFEQGLATAKQRADQAKTAEAKPSGSLVGSQPLRVSNVTVPAVGAGRVFQATIKRRAAGTPVIDVVFNGNQTFEMIVDTGASSTVITQAMADSLGIRVVGKAKVNTASQSGVEVPLGFVESIAVGNAVVKDVVVAIGNNALDTGLLGHDFFNDYDVTIKRDVVEFRKR